jgi:peptide/nickel transport system permease protein
LGPRVSEQQAEALREHLGLNDPIGVQYVRYLKDIVTFNFGNALTQGERPIRDELGERLPATLELSIPALIFTSLFGIALGAYAAKNRKKPIDYIIRLFSIFIYSIPIFFLGLLFQIIFGVRLNWLPLSGRMNPVLLTTFQSKTNFYIIDSIITHNWAALGSTLAHLVLPVVTWDWP